MMRYYFGIIDKKGNKNIYYALSTNQAKKKRSIILKQHPIGVAAVSIISPANKPISLLDAVRLKKSQEVKQDG